MCKILHIPLDRYRFDKKENKLEEESNPSTDLRSSLLNGQRMSGKSPPEFAELLRYFLRWVCVDCRMSF
jgi:hypothetical protein